MKERYRYLIAVIMMMFIVGITIADEINSSINPIGLSLDISNNLIDKTQVSEINIKAFDNGCNDEYCLICYKQENLVDDCVDVKIKKEYLSCLDNKDISTCEVLTKDKTSEEIIIEANEMINNRLVLYSNVLDKRSLGLRSLDYEIHI